MLVRLSEVVSMLLEKMTGKEWVPPQPSSCCLNTGSPKDGLTTRKQNCHWWRGEKIKQREVCFPIKNINSSTENTGIAFRWTVAFHIFVQFLPQSGCDKMSANASSKYNLTAAQSATSLSQTSFEQKLCFPLLTELEVVALTGTMCFSSCSTVYISSAIQVILIERDC